MARLRQKCGDGVIAVVAGRLAWMARACSGARGHRSAARIEALCLGAQYQLRTFRDRVNHYW